MTASVARTGAAAAAKTPTLKLAPASASAPASCAHCGLPVERGARFCCTGCEAAFAAIQGMGLGQYYAQRLLDPEARPPRPDDAGRFDLSHAVRRNAEGACELALAVDGLHCGACVWLIEHVLAREQGVLRGRVNMTTRRLALCWNGDEGEAERLVASVERLGYRLVPFDAAALAGAQDRTGSRLLRALGIAGFAAGNVMLISIGTWAGLTDGMGPATRGLMHWVSALIAMPAIAYAGMPFFTSALTALRHGHTNMDVPISVGVCLVTGMSLAETIAGGRHAYFDSAVTLLFFLLIGRLLDHRARGHARATAEQLMILRGADVLVVCADGTSRRCRQEQVAVGDRVLVGMGERVGVDGLITSGASMLDASLVTGESLPVAAGPGTQVFAGTLNVGPPITVRVNAHGDGTLLAECARLIDAAETRRGRFVVLADKVARAYTPVVHIAAAVTFAWWYLVAGVPFEQSLLTAAAVLIVTCPCALALAVPAVQVITAGRLFRQGILLKSATALERLASIDMVVFDKTGTLTEPVLVLDKGVCVDAQALTLARSIAASSRHPLARALVSAAGSPVVVAGNVEEVPGGGLRLATDGETRPDGDTRLGSADFCRMELPGERSEAGPELWLTRPGHAPCRFGFSERLRPDAAATVAKLRRDGLGVGILSGDTESSVSSAAHLLEIENWKAGCTPAQKLSRIEALIKQSHRVLMVGDGLNDGPCLAAATISASPSSAADISQNVADIVFQGRGLAPVAIAITAARRARRAMRQNLGFAIGYNLLLVPLAMAGQVTPWLAAAAMSSSSLLVMANSFRTGARRST